jgi:hypothetical protein
MRRGRLLTFGLFAVAAVLAIAAYAYFRFEQPPGFTELPDGWFVRPGREPAEWPAPNDAVAVFETGGALNLQIIAEDRQDVAVFLAGSSGVTPYPIGAGGKILINSDVKARCPATPRTDAPTLIARTPRSARIEITGAVAASAGPAERLQIVSHGCVNWRLASADRLWAAIDQGGAVHVDRVDDVRLNLRGRASASIGSVARSLDLVSRGPVAVSVGHLDGMVDAELWGRGHLDIGPGFAGEERLWIKGPGQILDHGEAGKVEAEARLRGKIRIRATRGVVSGAGDIQVGSPKAPLSDF